MPSKMTTKQDFSSGGVVWDASQEKFLLVQVENLAKKIVWTFPKGHPEKGESDEEAALREVREETGWRCEIDRPVKDVQYWYIRNGVRYHKTVRWFLMKPLAKVGVFQEKEIRDCRWMNLSETKTSIVYDSDKDLLKDVERLI